MVSSNTGIAVALLCAHGEFGDRVRESMAALGTPIVYEAEPQAFDRGALEISRANVVVVNLDARSDADFDNVYDLLDDARYRVVFNDDEVSGGLTGWDQARWMRHLAAKIVGDADIDPPRPADAEVVPTPVVAAIPTQAGDVHGVASVAKAAAPVVAAVGLGAAWLASDAVPAAALPTSPADQAATADMIDFDAIVDGPDSAQSAPAWSALDAAPPSPAGSSAQSADGHAIDAVDLSGFDDIALDFDAPGSAAPPPLPSAAAPFAEHDFDLDSLDFDTPASPETAPQPATVEHFSGDDFDLDSLDFDTPASPEPALLPSMAGAHAKDDFDLDSLDFDAPAGAEPAPGPSTAEHFYEDGIDLGSLDFDSIVANGAVSAFDFGAETHPYAATDSEALPTSHIEAPATAGAAAPGLAFASNEWTLEDVLDDVQPAPAVPVGVPAFGIEKLRAEEFLAPDVEVNEAHPFEVPQGLSLELIPLEEAIAPIQAEVASRENWLDPDAVQPKVRRVWVLGASIGGPEAVREFLTALPRDYPALFILAQHLGDEFVDMMAKQLAQATALTVRTPIHGARVGHGEVVIVPNGKRLLVDPMGVVVLERDTEQRAFSPSIDRVLRDMADRFGSNAGAIVFSGMTDDAVEGCRYLAQKGGLIYAQRQDTCVVSTMIDGVCAEGIVNFQGSPQELAEKLIAG